jgi:putative transposase
MKYDPQIHHRRSIRLKGFDYSHPGVYFVTLCTFQRDEIFGALVNEEMQLSPLGRIARTEWFRSAEIRQEIQLFKTEFVLMPNHLHGIVWIVDEDVRPAENDTVGADGIRPDGIRPPDIRPELGEDSGASMTGAYHAPLRRAPRPLASFIAGYKAAVTGRAGRELNSANIWQRIYYEHIVRNENELQIIRVYIYTNPQRWHQDQLHPSASPNRFNQDNP